MGDDRISMQWLEQRKSVNPSAVLLGILNWVF
jgi:hypothetical protein